MPGGQEHVSPISLLRYYIAGDDASLYNESVRYVAAEGVIGVLRLVAFCAGVVTRLAETTGTTEAEVLRRIQQRSATTTKHQDASPRTGHQDEQDQE